MNACFALATPPVLCDALMSHIEGEARDKNQTGIVQLTAFDETSRTAKLLSIGVRRVRRGAFLPFSCCPFCGGQLPKYPKP